MNSKAKEKDCKSDCEFIGDGTILLILVQDPSDWFGLYSPFKVIQDSTSFILRVSKLPPSTTFSSSSWAVCSLALHPSDSRGGGGVVPAKGSVFFIYTHVPRIVREWERTWKAFVHSDELYKYYRMFFIVLVDDNWHYLIFKTTMSSILLCTQLYAVYIHNPHNNFIMFNLPKRLREINLLEYLLFVLFRPSWDWIRDFSMCWPITALTMQSPPLD